MTTPTSPPPLKEALYTVTAEAVTELDPVWQLAPTEIRKALFDVLPSLVDRWSLASASVAADWYDELRAAKAIAGRFTAIVPPLDNLGAEALAGWGAQPLHELQPVNLDTPSNLLRPSDTQPATLSPLELAQSRVEGGLQKRLVNAANETVTHSAAEDPNARGWMRQTRPEACKFCVMVASRLGVFTKVTATFACHEKCYCEALPVWGGEALPVKPYKPSDKPMNAADRARVRKWIKDNLS
jgi:hypothetical protein